MARKRKRSLLEQVINSPAEKEQSTSPKLTKYWLQRYDLFSRYDEGIQMDEEGWYSVTPEKIAVKQAERCRGKVVIDCFSGVGGNTIQFAKVSSSVIAIDIDPVKVEMAINNAMVYGVDDRVDYVVGDFIHLAPSLKGDVLFLSPPWGGPMYNKVEIYTLDMLQPKDGYKLFQIAQTITPNIIMFLPRNVDLAQLEELAWLSSPPLTLEIEENYVQGKIKAIKAYFSCSAKKNSTFHLSESPTELESDLRQVLKIVQNSETTIKKLVLDLEASFDRKMDKLIKEIKEIKTLLSRFTTRW